MENSVVIATTPRLILRLMTLADAAFMLELLNSDGFIEHIGDRQVRTLAEAKIYIAQGTLQSYQVYGHGMYVMELLHTGQPIGVAGLVKRPELEHTDLGYALLPSFFQQGYAIEAARAVLVHSDELRLNPLVAIVAMNNLPSINLLQKLGFTFQHQVSFKSDEKLLLFKRELEFA
ncbi:GNAT family N-acetyltransferase [Shewanella sp. Isolate11]|uniref:GNAT family N-acetyltransferase n=1 Tax=Shewanella sp. Isolate11 TaxID=2908530 RepID=UPI001EFEC523|nr:GNAT family N-acetyltransferase [Shewanella sp. Isolate11]MCG9696443.1 GNAT family N-acetyltransferase [Shewanella sp. Isolate11]